MPHGPSRGNNFSTVPAGGDYEIRLAWQPHENRATSASVSINSTAQTLNMRQPAARKDGFQPLGVFTLKAGGKQTVVLSAKDAGGNVQADALWMVKK